MRYFLVFALSSVLALADTLTDLRARLSQLGAQSPVRVRVDYGFSSQQGDGDSKVLDEGRAKAEVEEGQAGMRIFWERATLEQAAREMAAKALDPDKKTPTRHVMDALDPQTLADYLNASSSLLRRLEGASLVEERQDTFAQAPARLLVLKLAPKMSAQDKKYVKHWESQAKVWLGADGLPLAAETSFLVKGRAFLVITFESSQRHLVHYAQHDGRLVVVYHEKEDQGSGGGEKGHEKALVRLEILGG